MDQENGCGHIYGGDDKSVSDHEEAVNQRASPSSDHVPIEEKMPSPTKDVRPHLKVGGHVCVHSRFMGSSHLPCCIVREFNGCYQLYCANGVLIN